MLINSHTQNMETETQTFVLLSIGTNNENTNQWGNNYIEVPQVHILWAAEFRSKDIHKHFKVFRSFCKVTCEVTEDRVQLPAKDEQ